jgi:hypothetical protein
MGVLGAYSNPETQERLRRLVEKLGRLAASDASSTPTTRQDRRLRSGVLAQAIMRVLEDSVEPMRVRDVHAMVDQQLDQPVSMSAIKTWLARHAAGNQAVVLRVGRGRYRSVQHT